MHRYGLWMSALLAAGLAASPVKAGPSFDCSNAVKATEKAICDYDTLGKLDVLIYAEYQTVVSLVPSKEKGRVQWEHKAWLTTRNRCGYSSLCIKESYQDRRGRLDYWQKKYGKSN